MAGEKDRPGEVPPVYVVSGGAGTSGKQVVEAVLAQFPGVRVPILEATRVRNRDQAAKVVAEAAASGGTIVHTLVDGEIREELVRLAEQRRVSAIDIMGPLLVRLASVFGREPLGQPGLYRQLRRDYFDRVEAIEFAVAHDDGQRPQDLPSADLVLVGVSRCGKTPLSMYLAGLGWKVANVPLIPAQPPPAQLDGVDPRRVIGLSIGCETLLAFRRKRQSRIGVTGAFSYTNATAVFEELEEAIQMCRRRGFTVVDVTEKPIESSADEILQLMNSRIRGKRGRD